MLTQPDQKISPQAIKVWRINDGILYGTILLILIIFLFIQSIYHWPSWVKIFIYVLILFSIISCLFEICIIPIYRLKHWRYSVDEKFIQLKYGGFLLSNYLVIPMSKVQYVNTHQGPVLKKYNLFKIEIGTMSSTHEIPSLPEKKAFELREQIAFLAGLEND